MLTVSEILGIEKDKIARRQPSEEDLRRRFPWNGLVEYLAVFLTPSRFKRAFRVWPSSLPWSG